jgi:hypothetical protein
MHARFVRVPPYGRQSRFRVTSPLQRVSNVRPARFIMYRLERNDARCSDIVLRGRRVTHHQIPRIYVMKSIYLTPAACAVLLFGCAIANAQTSNPPSDKSSTAPVSNQADTTKGNDVVGTTPTDQTSSPPTTGQDKSSGNDMVSSKADASHSGTKLASAARPDFNTLDTTKRGTLTADDVKGNKWLSQNFKRCDSDHDGTLSREEYAACK